MSCFDSLYVRFVFTEVLFMQALAPMSRVCAFVWAAPIKPDWCTSSACTQHCVTESCVHACVCVCVCSYMMKYQAVLLCVCQKSITLFVWTGVMGIKVRSMVIGCSHIRMTLLTSRIIGCLLRRTKQLPHFNEDHTVHQFNCGSLLTMRSCTMRVRCCSGWNALCGE